MRVFKWAALVVAALLLVGVVVLMKQLPKFINNAIQDYMARNHPDASLAIEDISVAALRPGSVTLSGVTFKSSRTGTSELEFAVERVALSLDLLPLMKGEVRLGSVRVDLPRLIYRDSDAPPSPERAARPPRTSLPFELRGFSLRGGEFTYIRMTKGTVASLHLHDIEIAAKPFGFSEDLVDASARARIEKSGSVEIDLKMPLLARPAHIDVEVRIAGQNLADLTPFFEENAGVVLKGEMVKARSLVEVRGSSADVRVWATYRDFSLKLVEMHDRSPTAAFFTNLGAAIAMSSKNLDKPREDQQRAVRVTREPGESWVSFILRGMKEAALKVTMAN